ncbi:putative gnat family protein [Botrytis fragariae]|uniref:Putative gnat family protein n=1 Tax=Botrytis fragariae TaxID=1964551 RepID=A0A8H6ASS7_9HELO|nr:putative gnat family protein [Botrytis fragariae]KAF5872967.1 putative gnat family protein [Botrytis fragariae]
MTTCQNLNSQMTLQLQPIDSKVDFPTLTRCLFESYESPWQKFFHLWFPIQETSDNAREDAINEAASRLKLWHTHDPSSYWQKVNGRIAGGALWRIYNKNPFETPPPSTVIWFPDDSSRRYAEQALQTHSRPRYKVAQKPHIYHRRQGVGQQFMNWGMKKADELGYEFLLDATPYGRPLYDVNGFVYVEENINHPKTDTPDEKWKEIDEKVGSFTFWLMRRLPDDRNEVEV